LTPRAEPWLEIDLKGFAQILSNKGLPRVLLEPISNAFDTKANVIEVFFEQKDGRALLEVTDDDPEGFADLRDAYTLFAPSKRRDDPTKRGRFGQGDKELIAICANGGFVTVRSTTGTIRFEQSGRSKTREKSDSGTWLCAGFKCNQAQAKEFAQLVQTLIVPDGIKLTFNGQVILRPEPVKMVKETLPTVIADGEGNLSQTRRQTTIELFEPTPGETPYLYELGVPVVDHDGRWHVNIGQKIPLNAARDNVTPAYLRRIREIMLNETHAELTEVDHKRGWVKDALATASDEAIQSHITTVYGPNAVIFDPSDQEASKRALEKGWTVVHGRTFDTDTWKRIKDADILKPAGQVLPSGVPTSPDGKPPIPWESWTPAMKELGRYAGDLGEHLLGFRPGVEFHNIQLPAGHGHTAAWWGGSTVTFNLRVLGKRWPEEASQVEVDELCLHEFAHANTGNDHFTDRYINKLSHLGALLRSFKGALR
jgi:hypothetical protein